MSLVLFTGSFAVVSNEIDWLVRDEMRVSPSGEMVSWGVMEAAVRRYKPYDSLESLSAMHGDYFAYRARMRNEYGRLYFIHVNQWTGEVTGVTPWLTVQRFFRDLHRYLFLPRNLGLPLVTSLAFILAISLYTGLKTTRNWRTVATRIRFGRNARIVIGDSHKAAGIWGVWFIVIIIITGLWYLAEFGAGLAMSRPSPSAADINVAQAQKFGSVIQDANADVLIAATKHAYPELKPRALHFALSANDAANVVGRNNDFLIRDRANRVSLNPVDASVIQVQRAKDIGILSYLNEVADPLHFGYFGNLLTKIIWFIFGLMLTGLSVSGVWLSWKRLKTRSPSTVQFATMPVIVVVIVYGGLWYKRIVGPENPVFEKSYSVEFSEQINGKLFIASDNNGLPIGPVRLLISAHSGRPNIKSVHFNFSSSDGVDKTISLRRLGQNISVQTEFPASILDASDSLTTTLQLASDNMLSAVWTINDSVANERATKRLH